ncbi:MAG: restriction endonuclease subunit S [Clostridia bacterium]|nr:restriction endonuclease subunit S [Clostridia bacterium]
MREMKNSGVEWIGEIPIDWDVVKVSYLFRIGRGRVIAQTELEDNGKYPVYSSQTKNDGCLGYINTYDFDLEQITWTTDGANAGTIFLRKGKHNCTNVCGTLQPLNPYIDLRYQKYALEYIAFYHKRADTNGFKIMNNEMAAIHTICPSLPEQHRIADFLDEKCAKIDAVIEKQQQVIEKLKEYKLSVITEAVTKGLDPTVPMKDSGVEWIGEIPVDWELTTIARVATVVRGASPRPAGDPKYFNGNDVPWITVAEVTKDEGKYIYSTETYLTKEGALHSRLVNKGTLLLSNSGATLGVPKVTKIDGCINDGSVAFYDLKLEQFYLFYVFKARTYELRKQMQGYGQPNLNTSIIKTIELPLPTREVQGNIVKYLDKKSVEIDSAIAKKKSIVAKLTEYKKSLIYEVVTGKREV